MAEKNLDSVEDIEEKNVIDDWKDQQDSETRRNVRNVWIVVSICTFLLGYFLGSLF